MNIRPGSARSPRPRTRPPRTGRRTDDAVRDRQPVEDPPAEVAHREESRGRARRRRPRRSPHTIWISAGRPFRKLMKPNASPRTTIANRSRIRSMNTVPTVRLSETGLLILRRYARYRSPSLAGTRQLTSHERRMISVESRTQNAEACSPAAAGVQRSRATGSRGRRRRRPRGAAACWPDDHAGRSSTSSPLTPGRTGPAGRSA